MVLFSSDAQIASSIIRYRLPVLPHLYRTSISPLISSLSTRLGRGSSNTSAASSSSVGNLKPSGCSHGGTHTVRVEEGEKDFGVYYLSSTKSCAEHEYEHEGRVWVDGGKERKGGDEEYFD